MEWHSTYILDANPFQISIFCNFYKWLHKLMNNNHSPGLIFNNNFYHSIFGGAAPHSLQMSSTVRSENINFHVANLYVSSKTLLETRYPHIIFHSHFMFIEILTLFLILLYLDSININIYRNENRVVLNRMGWINTVPLTNWKLGLFVLLISRMKIHTYKQNAFHEPIENP